MIRFKDYFYESTPTIKALKPLMVKHNQLYNHYASAVKQYDRDEMEKWHKEMMKLGKEIEAVKNKYKENE